MRPGDLLFRERTLTEQYAAGERELLRTTRHRLSIWKPVARALGVSLLWGWYFFAVPNPGGILDVLSVAAIALWLWVAWSEWERRRAVLVVTNQRMLIYEGILTRTIPMMRLSKVTDLVYHRPVIGRLLGYGTITIESAGQEQAFHSLDYLPDADSVYATLAGALFGQDAKIVGRSKPKLPFVGKRRRGRRGGDDGDDDGYGDEPGGPGGSGNYPPGAPGGGSTTDGSPGGPAHDPYADPTAYRDSSSIDAHDVPPPGAGPSLRSGSVSRGPARERTVYQSPDRRPKRAAEIDTGPIPISQRPQREH